MFRLPVRFQRTKKDNAVIKLDDGVVVLFDINKSGTIISKGSKGIVDNRLASVNGIKYIVIINDKSYEFKREEIRKI